MACYLPARYADHSFAPNSAMESRSIGPDHDHRCRRRHRLAANAVRLLRAVAALSVRRQWVLSDAARGRARCGEVVLAGLAVLYNPIAPVKLGSKPLRSAINIATVVWFWRLNGQSGVSY